MNPAIMSASETAAIISKLTDHVSACAKNHILAGTGLTTARTLEKLGRQMAEAIESNDLAALEIAAKMMTGIAAETVMEETGQMPTHTGGMLQ